jgi:hypothetical protein
MTIIHPQHTTNQLNESAGAQEFLIQRTPLHHLLYGVEATQSPHLHIITNTDLIERRGGALLELELVVYVGTQEVNQLLNYVVVVEGTLVAEVVLQLHVVVIHQ